MGESSPLSVAVQRENTAREQLSSLTPYKPFSQLSHTLHSEACIRPLSSPHTNTKHLTINGRVSPFPFRKHCSRHFRHVCCTHARSLDFLRMRRSTYLNPCGCGGLDKPDDIGEKTGHIARYVTVVIKGCFFFSAIVAFKAAVLSIAPLGLSISEMYT